MAGFPAGTPRELLRVDDGPVAVKQERVPDLLLATLLRDAMIELVEEIIERERAHLPAAQTSNPASAR